MSKNMWMICGSIVIVLITITLVALLILFPQETLSQGAAAEKYDKIDKNEYVYTPSKEITEDALIEEYKVDSEALREGKADKNYIPGNVDPFATQEKEEPSETGKSVKPSTGTNAATGTNTASGTKPASENSPTQNLEGDSDTGK